jgi:ubiquinone/menaquinone biosynthesis C-methylase UbiE
VTGHPGGIVATVTHLPFPDKTFGAALASHLLEHLYNVDEAKQALEELSRVAEKVFIAYPTRQSFAAWIIPDHRLWVWQKEEIVYLLQRHSSSKSIEEQYKLTDGRRN